MASKVYVETTIISYLTARPSRDLLIAAHQQVTREWWESARPHFMLVSSQLVVQEASAGDSEAAQERLALLDEMTLLETTHEAFQLAQYLLEVGAIPASYPSDALHVAIAVVNGVNYLLTWNYKHLANATMRGKIENACRAFGYEPVLICAPEELMEW